MRVIAQAECRSGNCPALYSTPDEDVAVQGYVRTEYAALTPTGVQIPAGEAIVVIPGAVFRELVEQYLHARAAGSEVVA